MINNDQFFAEDICSLKMLSNKEKYSFKYDMIILERGASGNQLFLFCFVLLADGICSLKMLSNGDKRNFINNIIISKIYAKNKMNFLTLLITILIYPSSRFG